VSISVLISQSNAFSAGLSGEIELEIVDTTLFMFASRTDCVRHGNMDSSLGATVGEFVRNFLDLLDLLDLHDLPDFPDLHDLGALVDLPALPDLGALIDLFALPDLGALIDLPDLGALINLFALPDLGALIGLPDLGALIDVFALPDLVALIDVFALPDLAALIDLFDLIAVPIFSPLFPFRKRPRCTSSDCSRRGFREVYMLSTPFTEWCRATEKRNRIREKCFILHQKEIFEYARYGQISIL
jgi:hypothetical protein